MARYVDVEPLIDEGWQLQRYSHGDGFVCVDHRSLVDLEPADVRPPASKAEQGICTKLASVLVECAFETAGCGLCYRSGKEGCSHTRLLLAAADAIRRLLKEESP